jgi:hypothetical protein
MIRFIPTLPWQAGFCKDQNKLLTAEIHLLSNNNFLQQAVLSNRFF